MVVRHEPRAFRSCCPGCNTADTPSNIVLRTPADRKTCPSSLECNSIDFAWVGTGIPTPGSSLFDQSRASPAHSENQIELRKVLAEGARRGSEPRYRWRKLEFSFHFPPCEPTFPRWLLGHAQRIWANFLISPSAPLRADKLRWTRNPHRGRTGQARHSPPRWGRRAFVERLDRPRKKITVLLLLAAAMHRECECAAAAQSNGVLAHRRGPNRPGCARDAVRRAAKLKHSSL